MIPVHGEAVPRLMDDNVIPRRKECFIEQVDFPFYRRVVFFPRRTIIGSRFEFAEIKPVLLAA